MCINRSQSPAGSARGLRRLVLTTVLLVGTTVLGATAEAQQLPKSGKYTGKYASHQVTEVTQTYELEKGHVFFLGHRAYFSMMPPMVSSTKPRLPVHW